MKRNALFEQLLAKVAPETKAEVELNIDIANRIYDLLKEKGMSQREFAEKMGKKESEISRWMTGSHGFTTSTLAKISSVLGESIVEVKRKSCPQFVVIPHTLYVTPTDVKDGSYSNGKEVKYQCRYPN